MPTRTAPKTDVTVTTAMQAVADYLGSLDAVDRQTVTGVAKAGAKVWAAFAPIWTAALDHYRTIRDNAKLDTLKPEDVASYCMTIGKAAGWKVTNDAAEKVIVWRFAPTQKAALDVAESYLAACRKHDKLVPSSKGFMRFVIAKARGTYDDAGDFTQDAIDKQNKRKAEQDARDAVTVVDVDHLADLDATSDSGRYAELLARQDSLNKFVAKFGADIGDENRKAGARMFRERLNAAAGITTAE